jgi:hypothetical protein
MSALGATVAENHKLGQLPMTRVGRSEGLAGINASVVAGSFKSKLVRNDGVLCFQLSRRSLFRLPVHTNEPLSDHK